MNSIMKLYKSQTIESQQERLQKLPLSTHISRLEKEISKLSTTILAMRNDMLSLQRQLNEKSNLRKEETTQIVGLLNSNVDKLKDNFNKNLNVEKQALSNLTGQLKKIVKQQLKTQQQQIVVEKKINEMQLQAGFKEFRLSK